MKLKKLSEVMEAPLRLEDNLGKVLPFQGGRYRLDENDDVIDSGVINRYPNPIDLFLLCNESSGESSGSGEVVGNTVTDFFDSEFYMSSERYACVGSTPAISSTYANTEHGNVIYMSGDQFVIHALFEDGTLMLFDAGEVDNAQLPFYQGIYSEAWFVTKHSVLQTATHTMLSAYSIYFIDASQEGVTKIEATGEDGITTLFDIPTGATETFKGAMWLERDVVYSDIPPMVGAPGSESYLASLDMIQLRKRQCTSYGYVKSLKMVVLS